jgi:hypothetical protein
VTPDELLADAEKSFGEARFSAGLLVAFIDLMVEVGSPGRGYVSFGALLGDFPLRERTAAGKPIKQLELDLGGGRRAAIRGKYNKIETFFRAEKKRFEYPSAPGHATSAWRGYTRWLDALVQFSPEELADVRQRVVDHVLNTLPAHEIDPSQLRRDPALFELLLTEFDLAPRGDEKTGAALQGLVFGFMRADNPHLQIEVDKVRAGGRRLGRVGDVAGWNGARLAVSAEVKQYTLSNLSGIEAFAAEISERGAIGIVAALDFGSDTRDHIQDRGLIPLSIEDMASIVRLWDTEKQRIAVASAMYYFDHIEKSSSLRDRLEQFCREAVQEHRAALQAADAAAEEPQEG